MTWDVFRAEYADTVRGQHKSRPALPCRYCGHPTKSLYQVCLAHDDLIDLDAGYPAALESADTLMEPHPSVSAVSSASLPASPLGVLPVGALDSTDGQL